MLAGNRATTGMGGAVYAYEGANFHATGCTLADNESADCGGGLAWVSIGSLSLTNCILFHNRATAGFENLYQASSGTVQLAHLCTTPMPAAGFGHITNEPVFVDHATANFQLQSNSPCINAGINNSVSSTVDLNGSSRIMGGTLDIGAYEYQSPASVISYAWLQQYGLSTDGSADYIHSDADPLNNWQEWVAYTNPTNGASCLHIASVSKGPPATVAVTSDPGRLYTLLTCTNLAGNTWTAVSGQTDLPGIGGLLQLVDTNLLPAAYYRVGIRVP